MGMPHAAVAAIERSELFLVPVSASLKDAVMALPQVAIAAIERGAGVPLEAVHGAGVPTC